MGQNVPIYEKIQRSENNQRKYRKVQGGHTGIGNKYTDNTK